MAVQISSENFIQVFSEIGDNGVNRLYFDKILFIAHHMAFSERVRSYFNIDSAKDDGLPEIVQQAISSALSNNAPVVKVGRRSLNKAVIKLTGVFAPKLYQLKIGDTLYGYTSLVGDTETDIIDGIDAALTGVPKITVTKTATSIEVKYIDDDDAVPIKLTKNLTWESFDPNSSASTIVDDYDKIKDEDADFFHICIQDRDLGEVEKISSHMQTQDRIFYACVNDPLNYDSDASIGFGAELYDKGRNCTCLFQSQLAASEFLDMASAGLVASKEPGTYTLNLKRPSNVSPDSITDTQYQNLLKKKINSYSKIEIFNKGITDGFVSSGRYLDIQIADFYFKAILKEELALYLSNEDKPPYTDDGGIADIKARTELVFKRLQDKGIVVAQKFLAEDGKTLLEPFTVNVVSRSNSPLGDRIDRVYNGLTYQAYLTGGIHKIIAVRGELNV